MLLARPSPQGKIPTGAALVYFGNEFSIGCISLPWCLAVLGWGTAASPCGRRRHRGFAHPSATTPRVRRIKRSPRTALRSSINRCTRRSRLRPQRLRELARRQLQRQTSASPATAENKPVKKQATMRPSRQRRTRSPPSRSQLFSHARRRAGEHGYRQMCSGLESRPSGPRVPPRLPPTLAPRLKPVFRWRAIREWALRSGVSPRIIPTTVTLPTGRSVGGTTTHQPYFCQHFSVFRHSPHVLGGGKLFVPEPNDESVP